MPRRMHFYMDDSGTRHPDHKPMQSAAGARNWFGLGGVLINEEDEEPTRVAHAAFCERWKFNAPLHSWDIRNERDGFAWLAELTTADKDRFFQELSDLLVGAPLIGHACAIDRPGYHQRYFPKYGRKQWELCKTAFSVSVERAAKFARERDRQLRVFAERADPKTDRRMKGYYDELRTVGMPFDTGSSGKYAPLTPTQFSQTLYEFRVKHKTSPMMQLADLYLWPMCVGGYDPQLRPFVLLKERGRLIDCHLSAADVPALGIKYSCWEMAAVRGVGKSVPDREGAENEASPETLKPGSLPPGSRQPRDATS